MSPAQIVSEVSILDYMDEVAKDPLQREVVNRWLSITLVAMATLMAVGLYFIAKPELALGETGTGLVALAAPMLTICTIALTWNNSSKNPQKSWAIAALVSTIVLSFAFAVSSKPAVFHTSPSVSHAIMGVSAPVLGTSIIKFILARAKASRSTLMA